VNTGIALANPGSQTANITFYFTDAAGATVSSGTTTIAGNSQIAAFLNQPPFTPADDFVPSLDQVRTFTFTSNVPVAIIALRGFTNERSEFLITTLPVTPLDAASSTPVSFPHYADGGGWKTQVVLVNPTDAPLAGSVQFYSQGSPTAAGEPVTILVNGISARTFTYSIPARGAFKLETASVDALVRSGWILVTPEAGSRSPAGLAVFSFKNAGVTVSEAGVPALPAGSAFRLYAEASGDFNGAASGSIQTGFGLSNPSSSSIQVSFELTTLAGVPLGLTGSTVVPANGQVAMFLNQIQGFGALQTPFQGILRVSGAGSLSVVGLRGRYNERKDFLITTTAPVNEAGPASTAEFIFPHLADGGGYTTQFVLFRGTVQQSSTGALRFYHQSGSGLNLTFR
jgi:hypothetical protein